MKNKKKKIIIGIGLNLILFINLFILIYSLSIPLKSHIFIDTGQKPIAKNLDSTVVNSSIFENLNFTLENLWSTAEEAFFTFQNEDGSFEEEGRRFHTSYCAWSYFTMLEISQLTNNFSYYYNYSIPNLEYILTHLFNKSNYGVYHWCFENGSLPSTLKISDFNSSTEQISFYQAYTILALLDAYNLTNNASYLNNYAIPMLNFLITTLWDADNNSFYRTYYYNGQIDTEKESWYQQWPIIALLEAYKTTGNITYAQYANKSLNFLLTYLYDDLYGGFYHYSLKNGSIPVPKGYTKYLTHQGGGISAITKAVTILNNFSLIDDYLVPTLDFIIRYLWNSNYKQFVGNTSRNGVGQYFIVRPSDISIFLKSILEIPENFNLSSYSNYILNSVSHIIKNMKIDNYFCRRFNLIFGVNDSRKYAIEQFIPLIVLCRIYNHSNYYSSFTNIFIWNEEDPLLFYKKTFIIGSIATIIVFNLLFLYKLEIHKDEAKYREKKAEFSRKRI